MVKIATVRKIESERQRAVDHVKNTIIFPSALLGLISIVVGYGALIYLMFKGQFITNLVVDSLVPMGVGILLGLAQFLYHRFLFDQYPDYYAQRRKRAELLRSKNIRKLETVTKPKHNGRWLVPVVYLTAFGVVLWVMVTYAARLNTLSAIFLTMAGFYNIRFFFWKRKLKV